MPNAGGLRICPFCKEQIGRDDARCPYCAEDLPALEPKRTEGTGKRRFNVTAVSIVGIVTCGFLVGFYIWSSHNRFYVVSGSQGVAYEVDRKTGESWSLYGARKTRHEGTVVPKTQGETIPPWEAAKITGNAGLSGFGEFSGKLYNGSSWTVTRVIFTVTAKDEGGATRWTRDLVENVEIAPLTTGSFSVSITGDQGVKDMSWSIKEAFGRKE